MLTIRVSLGELSTHMSERRFSSPWSVEELDACFVVTAFTKIAV
jgi:hypothetical protein